MTYRNHTAIAQQKRLETYLREHGRITTAKARTDLDIMSPAARIYELRHKKLLNIVTMPSRDIAEGGSKRPMADYVLLPGQYQESEYAGN